MKFNNTIKLIGIYILWVLLHYISAHLYVYFCVNSTILGLITSSFIVSSQHCVALRWIIVNGAENIKTLMMFGATWVVSQIILTKYMNYNTPDEEEE